MTTPQRAVVQIAVTDLHPHPHNVRSDTRTGLDELVQSIKAVGVLQPLHIQKMNSRLVIIDGHRRFHAAVLAGQRTVPCLPAMAADHRTQIQMMLASAMSARLAPLDMAHAFKALRDADLSVADIATRTGYSQATVRDRLALLDLPTKAQKMLAAGQLSGTDATHLARDARRQRAGARRGTTTRTDGVVPAARRQGWFTRQHRLADAVKAACTHTTERVLVGGVGCGQCWEHAIRTEHHA